MELILKFLTPDEQYRFLSKLLTDDVFVWGEIDSPLVRKSQVIQKIMDEINKK